MLSAGPEAAVPDRPLEPAAGPLVPVPAEAFEPVPGEPFVPDPVESFIPNPFEAGPQVPAWRPPPRQDSGGVLAFTLIGGGASGSW